MDVTTSDMVWRILAAFIAGFLLGWEREIRGRPAGLRTTILACVAAAIAMIVSEDLFAASAAESSGGSWRPDPARLGAGILTGIGFLGGGTILRHENFVRGVTTAATLWFATVLGLAFGSGDFLLGSAGVGIALVTLVLLNLAEKRIHSDWYAKLVVTVGLGGVTDDDLRKRLEALGITILSLRLTSNLESKQRVVEFELKLTRPERLEMPGKAVRELSACAGVTQLRWE